MKKLQVIVALGLVLQTAATVNASEYYKARNWYDHYARNISSSTANILADYAFCRVQEIDCWLRMERKDISSIESQIASEGHQLALKAKAELSAKIGYYDFQRYDRSALEAMRSEGNRIAQTKFDIEMLSSLFVQYKTGKRAAARMAKRDFFFECYKLLKNTSNTYRLW